MTTTDNDLAVPFDLTPEVHDLARRVLERGTVSGIIAFLAENGHLADLIRKAKAEAWAEGAQASSDLECGHINLAEYKNPYTEES